MLKEREYELESLREKVVNLQTLLQQYEQVRYNDRDRLLIAYYRFVSSQGKTTESQKYLKELDRANEQATSAKHERDQVIIKSYLTAFFENLRPVFDWPIASRGYYFL